MIERTPVIPDDLGRFADIREVGLSHDGRQLAAVISLPDVDANRYRNTVVLGPADGSASTRSLAVGVPEAAGLLRWSPVDGRIAVVCHGEAGWSIEVHDPAAQQVSVWLTGWPDPVEELCWSPDGAALLFVVREPADREYWELPDDRRPPLRLTTLRYQEDGVGWLVDRPRQAYVVTADGEPVRFSHGGFDDAEFSWHPDGRSVFFVSQRQPDRDRTVLNDVYQQVLDGDREPRRLTDTQWCYGSPRPSPDGALLSVTTLDVIGYPAAGHLGVLRLDTGELQDVSADLDRECSGPSTVWLDNSRVAAIVEESGSVGVRVFDAIAGGSTRMVGDLDRITSFDARAGVIAYVSSGPVDPPRLLVRRADGTEHEVAAPSRGMLALRDLRAPAHASVPVATGVEVNSWLVLPDPGRWPGPHPLIVWLQGGGTQYGYQWSHELQTLCSAGHAVLYLNPRGSAGYGTDWMRAVAGPAAAVPGTGWGVDDVADVITVVTATLRDHPSLSADRVGVLGGSYGGLVVTHLLAQTDLFAAGWAERGPYNLYSDAGTKDEAPWFFGAYLGGSHLEDPAAYWAASPLRLVEGITDPLMIVHSEQDRRCAIQQAEELFMALKLLDRQVEFVRFPGEGHNLTRSGSPVHRLQRLEIMLEWFGRWLSPSGADRPAEPAASRPRSGGAISG